MGLTVLQALDKAIDAGDAGIGAKDIGVTGKGPNILDELCSSGFLSKGKGKSPKYTITPEGRAAWERDASPERRQQVKHVEQQEKHKVLIEFLTVVQGKPGAALSKGDLSRFPDSLRQDACDRRLVEPGTKKNTYQILAEGDELLLAAQPPEQQIQRLRELHQQTVGKWKAVNQRLGQELETLGDGDVRAAAVELANRGLHAYRAFDEALAEMGAFAGLVTITQRLKASIETAGTEAGRRLGGEKERLADLEQRLRQNAEQQRQDLEEFERRLMHRLDDIAKQMAAVAVNAVPPHPKPDVPSAPSEAAVWETARRAYEELKKETFRIGGIVKVPDLTDRVRVDFADLTPAAIHEMLQKWQQADRLTLQLCNDPRLEPRAAEGIRSPRGLLFYVQMR